MTLFRQTFAHTIEGAIARLHESHEVWKLDLAHECDDLWVDCIKHGLDSHIDDLRTLDYSLDYETVLDNLYCEVGGHIFVLIREYDDELCADENGDLDYVLGYYFDELTY